MGHSELRMYLRYDNREPYGVVVSNSKNTFGWSMCNPRDQFSKTRGIQIARGREQSLGTIREYTRDPYKKEALQAAIDKLVEKSQTWFDDTPVDTSQNPA